MSNKPPENPYAFPKATSYGSSGMTLRDYFAGQVIAGLTGNTKMREDLSNDDFARISYSVADSMLRMRDQFHG